MPNAKVPRPSVAEEPDAIGLLMRDHRRLEQLFGRYGDARGGTAGVEARRLCDAIAVHLQVEAEIFYPAVSDALGRSIPGDGVEHDQTALGRLLAAVEQSESAAAAAEAVARLELAFAEHARAEEATVFRAIVENDIDLIGVGAALLARSSDLQEERRCNCRPAPAAAADILRSGRSDRG